MQSESPLRPCNVNTMGKKAKKLQNKGFKDEKTCTSRGLTIATAMQLHMDIKLYKLTVTAKVEIDISKCMYTEAELESPGLQCNIWAIYLPYKLHILFYMAEGSLGQLRHQGPRATATSIPPLNAPMLVMVL